ncbi:MAG TPA: MOSC domain-containing protein [Ignavibacteria bacterium]|nr:MOSC domain-containing protein [Ignavibacteria bacterium]HRJ98700.1 MOSC domain-containing protein [Ignavibacteria bacterium]
MKLISVNTGGPQNFLWNGKEVATSIFKKPYPGKCRVTFTNAGDDRQSDLIHHGGLDKAVYSYDYSYYNNWKKYFKEDNPLYGLFGENLTTLGMTDDLVFIGDIYIVGSVKLKAVQPRFPCFKLNIRFGEDYILNRFYDLGFFGTYFRVVEEGYLNAGDEIILDHRSQFDLTIADIVNCKRSKGEDREKLELILNNETIPADLRESLSIYKT